MSTPSFQIVNYTANSYIIVEGKKEAYNFYIVREGKVSVGRENPVVGEDPNQLLVLEIFLAL
jgi:CRP-like cAMP-binding protein